MSAPAKFQIREEIYSEFSFSIGFNVKTEQVYKMGPVPWDATDTHRAWTFMDDNHATLWCNRRGLNFAPRTVSAAISEIAALRRYWPPDGGTPDALAVLKTRDDHKWIVYACPYCKQRHEHGGGNFEDDPRQFLSHRIAHCQYPVMGAKGYNLVEHRLKTKVFVPVRHIRMLQRRVLLDSSY